MRLASRSGSSAVAKATMVKSGTRKNTNDRLIGCLMAFKRASPARRWREQDVAISKASSAKRLPVNEVRALADIKFATRAAFGLGRASLRLACEDPAVGPPGPSR